MNLPEIARTRLRSLDLRHISGGWLREAAVLMPIFQRGGDPHFLLTLRTEEVETHKGQVSFPGGMREGDESLETTALRETLEEVGIAGDEIEVLGRFHDYMAVTDARVTPFVGYLKGPVKTRPHPGEVAEVLEVPFSVFRDPARLRIEKRTRRGSEIEVYYYSWRGLEIWGLTARIIHDFLEALEPDDG